MFSMLSPLFHNAFRSALVIAACTALPASAAIFRCTAADGSVSYQEFECPASDHTRTLDVPTQYPTVDSTRRAELFAREAELDKRLEAQRERDSREAATHALEAPAQPIPAADDEGYPLYWGGAPLFQRGNLHPRHPIRNRPKVNPLDRRG
jgi:hypothetical protein